jgi:hypothetical protein
VLARLHTCTLVDLPGWRPLQVKVAIGNRALMAAEGVEVGPEVEEWMAGREQQAFTCVVLAVDGRVAAVLAITDPLKPEAKAVVAALQVRRLQHAQRSHLQRTLRTHASLFFPLSFAAPPCIACIVALTPHSPWLVARSRATGGPCSNACLVAAARGGIWDGNEAHVYGVLVSQAGRLTGALCVGGCPRRSGACSA